VSGATNSVLLLNCGQLHGACKESFLLGAAHSSLCFCWNPPRYAVFDLSIAWLLLLLPLPLPHTAPALHL
jgi:hypothetical protein